MLSIEDRFSIQDLYARYCACMDTGDIKGWANSWIEEGIFDSFQFHDGRAKIEEYGWGFMKRLPDMKWTNGQHWNDNIIVEGNGKTAAGLCYLAVVGKMKDTGELKIAAALSDAGALLDELKDFQRKVSDAGRATYAARTGAHDDLVLAVAIALWWATSGTQSGSQPLVI